MRIRVMRINRRYLENENAINQKIRRSSTHRKKVKRKKSASQRSQVRNGTRKVKRNGVEKKEKLPSARLVGKQNDENVII